MFKRLVSTLQGMRWPLRTKLGLALGILLVCFVINGLLSFFLIHSIQDSQDKQELTNHYLEHLQRYELIYNNGQLKTYSDAIFISNNTNIFDNFESVISNELQKRDKTIPLLGSTAFDVQFEQAYLEASKKFKEVGDLSRANQVKTAVERWPSFATTFKTVTDLLANQNKLLTQTRLEDEQKVTDELKSATFRIAIMAFLSVTLALSILILLQHVIVRPLNQLQSGLVKLSQGRFDRLDGQIINRDEIGNLAASFQAAVGSLEKVIQGVQITGALRNVTEKLAVVSKQQQGGSSEQIAALTQVLASMKELGQAAAQIANTTADVAGLSNQTLVQIERVAQSGINSQERTVEVTSVVNLTLNRIEEVGHQVEEFSRAMTHLNNQAAAINKVVELLGSIAEEVHLLALNAAIEAASAGEYGERFRVVAREIKDLAHRANRSTYQAQELVSGVQQSSQSTSLMVEKGRSLISTIYDANNQLNSSLNGLEVSSQEVAEAVETLHAMASQVNQRTEEIKQATKQQHLASEQVLAAIRSASEVADQSADSTNLIAASAHQLDNLTHQLSGVLSQVQVAGSR